MFLFLTSMGGDRRNTDTDYLYDVHELLHHYTSACLWMELQMRTKCGKLRETYILKTDTALDFHIVCVDILVKLSSIQKFQHMSIYIILCNNK